MKIGCAAAMHRAGLTQECQPAPPCLDHRTAARYFLCRSLYLQSHCHPEKSLEDAVRAISKKIDTEKGILQEWMESTFLLFSVGKCIWTLQSHVREPFAFSIQSLKTDDFA